MQSGSSQSPPGSLIEEFLGFVRAETWSSSRRTLEEHPGLLDPAALEFLRSWVASLPDDEDAWTYKYHYGLLQASQLMGVAGMFDNLTPSTGPTEGVVAPPEFADQLQRLADLDQAAARDPSVHSDRVDLLEQIVGRLDESHTRAFRGAALINLAQAYAQLPVGDPATNLRKAAAFLTEAAQFFTPKTAPPQYAASQVGLGRSYVELTTGDPTANLQKAIACFTEALRFYSVEYAPFDHAATQNDLGGAYARLSDASDGANLTRAIDCFTAALEILTPDAAPDAHAIVRGNLATARAKLGREMPESGDGGQ
jgi:tetratricopeptide (TPR) repeat protein